MLSIGNKKFMTKNLPSENYFTQRGLSQCIKEIFKPWSLRYVKSPVAYQIFGTFTSFERESNKWKPRMAIETV